MMRIFHLLIFILIFLPSFAQKKDKVYLAIPSDSTILHQLTFINDSTLKVESQPKHHSTGFSIMLPYKVIGTNIYVSRALNGMNDAKLFHGLKIEGQEEKVPFLSLVETGFTLYPNKKALLDTINKTIYVLYKDFQNKSQILYLIEGEKYIQEMGGLPNSYGIVNGKFIRNEQLNNRLKELEGKLENYDVKVWRGIEAFKKFGYYYVFGVIEISKKS